MQETHPKQFDVFTDEAFRQYLIAKFKLSASAKVFGATVEVGYGLERSDLEEADLGDRGNGEAADLIENMQDERSMRLPPGFMAVAIADGSKTLYSIENIRLFLNAVPITALQAVASEHLGVSTLESRNSDSLDFSNQSVWAIEAALKAAYELGLNNSKEV